MVLVTSHTSREGRAVIEFKVGDRVRLKGELWGGYTSSLNTRDVVVIQAVDEDQAYEFAGHDGDWWDVAAPGWEVELVQHVEFAATGFEQNIRRILDGVADTVASKNLAYGDSALNPIRVFSKSDRMEQLFVRLDDKLSRVQKGHEYPGDDTIRDIIGYCTLILIARESE